ncbi:MAG: hypothetical protein IJC16_09840 [Rikenellaceae bacterium]|nr:hypothetical protein [Rikenellaceae bacterium]
MINQIIANYLISNKRLVIPELGAFIRKDGDGKVVFVPFLKKDDGVLAGQLEEAYGLGRDEAEAVIEEYTGHIRQQIALKGEFVIDSVGVMRQDANDLLVFDYKPGVSGGVAVPQAVPGPDGMGDMFAPPRVPVSGAGIRPVAQHIPEAGPAAEPVVPHPDATRTGAANVREERSGSAEAPQATVTGRATDHVAAEALDAVEGQPLSEAAPAGASGDELPGADRAEQAAGPQAAAGPATNEVAPSSAAALNIPVRETIADREASQRKSLNDLYAGGQVAGASKSAAPVDSEGTQEVTKTVGNTIYTRGARAAEVTGNGEEPRSKSVADIYGAAGRKPAASGDTAGQGSVSAPREQHPGSRPVTSKDQAGQSARSLYSGRSIREARTARGEGDAYVAPPVPKQRYQRPAPQSPVQYRNKKKADLIMIVAIVAAIVAILAMLYGLLFSQAPMFELDEVTLPAQTEMVDVPADQQP